MRYLLVLFSILVAGSAAATQPEPDVKVEVTPNEAGSPVAKPGRPIGLPASFVGRGRSVRCAVKVTTDKKGRVNGVDSERCPDSYLPFVAEALPTWRFEPHRVAGKKRPYTFGVTVDFTMSEAQARLSREAMAAKDLQLTQDTRGKHLGTVTTADALVLGALPPDQVTGVIGPRIGKVEYCYHRLLVKDPTVRGTVSLRFTIDSDGSVRTTDIAGSTTGNADLDTCVAATSLRWLFPEVPGGGIAIVTYRFTFSPE